MKNINIGGDTMETNELLKKFEARLEETRRFHKEGKLKPVSELVWDIPPLYIAEEKGDYRTSLQP